MKIALISDVHAEFYKNDPDWLPPLPENPDVLVLAGDIHIGKLLVPFIERISNALPYTHLVVIAGNHEFYRQYRLATLKAYREAFVKHPRIHFLENDYVDINGVRFIGATLWTGFPLHSIQYTSEQVMNYARDNVSDFSLIAEDSGDKVVAFSPEMTKILFDESKAKLTQALEKSDTKKCVVVTHFPPAKKVRHPKFALDKVTSYFTADCEDIIKIHQPAYWFYGHNHWSSATCIGNTILLSNQFGYPNERWKMGGDFNPNLTIEI